MVEITGCVSEWWMTRRICCFPELLYHWPEPPSIWACLASSSVRGRPFSVHLRLFYYFIINKDLVFPLHCAPVQISTKHSNLSIKIYNFHSFCLPGFKSQLATTAIFKSNRHTYHHIYWKKWMQWVPYLKVDSVSVMCVGLIWGRLLRLWCALGNNTWRQRQGHRHH